MAPAAPRAPDLARLGATLALVVVATLAAKGRLRALDDAIWDRLQAKLPARTPATAFALVGIGQPTLEAQGGYPFPRRVHARALDRLTEFGAQVVAVDVLFLGLQGPEDDAALAAAVARNRPLLPYKAGWETVLDPAEGPVQRFVVESPPAGLTASARGSGFANLPLDANPDHVFRRVWLAQAGEGGQQFRAFGVELAQSLGARVAALPTTPARLDLRAVKGDQVTRVELQDLLDGTPAARQGVAGRAVILGATAEVLGDIKSTPVGRLPGALLHVAVAENLLAGGTPREATGVGAALALAGGLVGVLRVEAAVLPWLGVALAAATLLLTVGGALAWVHLGAGAGLVAGAGVVLAVLLARLAPKGSPQRGPTSVEEAAAALVQRLEEGDARGARRLVADLPPDVQGDPLVRFHQARALVPAGMEGALEKALAAARGAPVDPGQRAALAEDLEAAGYTELALCELEDLYQQDASLPGVGDRLFQLRQARDRRWGVLSPRALRDLLGRDFRALESLGEGAEGLVLGARRRQDDAPVVLKVMHPRRLDDPAALARFRHEEEALRAIDHPAFPRLVEARKGRVPFLVMQRRAGAEWRLDELAAGNPIPKLAALVEAVQALHRAGWVHRDLKPENLLWEEGQGLSVLDLGLAARIGEGVPGGGTLPWAAPEQLVEEGPAGPGQDVHAVGRLGLALGLRSPAFEAAAEADPGARSSLDQLAAAL